MRSSEDEIFLYSVSRKLSPRCSLLLLRSAASGKASRSRMDCFLLFLGFWSLGGGREDGRTEGTVAKRLSRGILSYDVTSVFQGLEWVILLSPREEVLCFLSGNIKAPSHRTTTKRLTIEKKKNAEHQMRRCKWIRQGKFGASRRRVE